MRNIFTMILVFCAVIPSFADPSGLSAGVITYKHLGNYQYLVTAHFYNRCGHIQLNASTILVRSQNYNFQVNTTNSLNASTDRMSAACSANSRCNGGSSEDYRKVDFQTVIDFSNYVQTDCVFKLAWWFTSRPSNVNTISGYPTMHIESEINVCIPGGNSSPKFQFQPIYNVCRTQDISINLGAVDSFEFDSLSYELVDAKTHFNTNVSYLGAFSAQRPLRFSGFPNQNLPSPSGFNLNPVNGTLKFRPTDASDLGTVVIKVTEWRKVFGSMAEIGSTSYEFIVRVVNCSNSEVPKFSASEPVYACVGKPVCFGSAPFLTNQTDTIRLKAASPVSGVTVTTNSGQVRRPSLEFCWTPDSSHLSPNPYPFYVQAVSDACPTFHQAQDAIMVYVVPPIALSQHLITKDNCGKVRFSIQAANHPASNAIRASWRFIPLAGGAIKTSSRFADSMLLSSGSYRVEGMLTLSGACEVLTIDTIQIDPYLSVQIIGDDASCSSVPLRVNQFAGQQPVLYQWIYPALNSQSPLDTVSTYLANPPGVGRYPIMVSAQDAQGCKQNDTFYIQFQNIPSVDLGSDTAFCSFNSFVLSNKLSNPASYGPYEYLWSDGSEDTILTVNQPDTFSLRVRDALGCEGVATIRVVENNVTVDAGVDTAFCSGEQVRLSASGAAEYEWYNIINFRPFPLPAPEYRGQNIQYTATNAKSWVVRGSRTILGTTCQQFDTVTAAVNPKPTIQFNQTPEFCLNHGSIDLNQFVQSSSFGGIWPDWNNGLVPANTLSVIGGKGQGFAYQLTNSFGCSQRDSLFLRVSAFPTVTTTVPADLASDVSVSPQFRWNGIQGIARYLFRIFDEDLNLVHRDTVLGTLYFYAGPLAGGKQYLWRVDGINSSPCGPVPMATLSSFNTRIDAPMAPVLFAPDSASSFVNTNPIVSWFSTQNATQYEIQISTGSDFRSTNTWTQETNDTFANSQTLQNRTTYFWRVQAKNSTGLSPWSRVWRFETEPGTGIEALNNNFKVYPNPNKGDLVIETKNVLASLEWECYDVNGKRVANGVSVSDQTFHPISLNQPAEGIYLMVIKTIGSIQYIKVVIQP